MANTPAFYSPYHYSSIMLDLQAGTCSGQTVAYLMLQSGDIDNYAFADVTLGSAAHTGTIVGDNTKSDNSIVVSVSGSTLSIVESQDTLDQAYMVEFLTDTATSADYLGAVSTVLDAGGGDKAELTWRALHDFRRYSVENKRKIVIQCIRSSVD